MAFIVFEGMAIFLLVLLIPVLYTHVPLACSNRTAIENNYANMDNPYDLGLRQANLEQILGVFGYDWFIPMKPLNPQTDGISFLRKDDPASSMDTSIDKTDMLQAESLWRMRYQIRKETPSDPEFGPLRSISRWLTGEGDAGDDDGSPMSPANHQVTAGCGPWRRKRSLDHVDSPGDSSRDLLISWLEVTIRPLKGHLTIPKRSPAELPGRCNASFISFHPERILTFLLANSWTSQRLWWHYQYIHLYWGLPKTLEREREWENDSRYLLRDPWLTFMIHCYSVVGQDPLHHCILLEYNILNIS